MLLAACLLLFAGDTLADLEKSLVGKWVGTLEYRDFSEPASSNKRVKLPTWLDVAPVGADLRFLYVYDDGPGKTVKEISTIHLDLDGSRYIVLGEKGKVESTYAIAGLDQLQSGRGTLTLAGKGTENNVPVNVRTTLRIGRNILEVTRETAVEGQMYAFRHAYTFVRMNSPEN